MKKIKMILKYISMSILFAIISVIVNHDTNKGIDIKGLIMSSVIYFLILCLIAFIAPFLRRLFGYDDKE